MEFLRRHSLLALMALALLLAFAFQGTRGLRDPDEGRYTNVTLQILRSGDWVSLHWEWVCDVLTRAQLASLRRLTAHQLSITNRSSAR